jgi:hypothetical protein
MAVITVCLAIGTGLLALSLHSMRFSTRANNQIEATCAADAGITRALFEMNSMIDNMRWGWDVLPEATNVRLPSCDALYSYTITGDANGGYTVGCIGKSGPAGVTKKIKCSVRLQGLFEYAMLMKQNIVLKSGLTVDGYNSSDAGDTDVHVKIATDACEPNSIIINPGTTVNADILVGIDGDPDIVIKDLGGTMNGNTYAMIWPEQYPVVTAPALPDMGSIKTQGETKTITPADSGAYSVISLKNAASPATLAVDGGDVVLHVTGDVSLGQSCEIVINPGSSLRLYLDGNLIADNEAGINNQGVPADFKLYGTGENQQIDLKAKGEFRGAVYAIDADVTVYSQGDVRGSIVADSCEIKSPSNFYYDEALRTVSVEEEGVRFVVERWYEQ